MFTSKIPPKSQPAAATTGQRKNLQKVIYHPNREKSNKNIPANSLVVQLTKELVTIQNTLRAHFLAKAERRIIHKLYQATARKLRAIA